MAFSASSPVLSSPLADGKMTEQAAEVTLTLLMGGPLFLLHSEEGEGEPGAPCVAVTSLRACA